MCVRGKGKGVVGGRATQPRRAPPRRPGRPKPTWVPPLRATSWWKPARAAGFIFTLASVYKGEVRSLVSADRRAATGCIYEQPRKGRLHSAEGRCSVSATSTCRLSCTTRLQYYGLQCGLLCTGRRCTTPLCASRGGRAAQEGAASHAICSSCHGARAGVWAHWSIGTRVAAVRAGGRIRVWAVRTGRARNPRAPGRSTRTRATLQTAQQRHRATFATR